MKILECLCNYLIDKKRAETRPCSLSSIFIMLYYLQFFRCESTLPANFFMVALVLLSLRALLAAVAILGEVTRHDFEHGICIHLLSFLQY